MLHATFCFVRLSYFYHFLIQELNIYILTVSCFNPGWQLSTIQLLTLPQWSGGRITRAKVIKLMGLDENRLVSKTKAMCTSQEM